jgi:hypothetical protein
VTKRWILSSKVVKTVNLPIQMVQGRGGEDFLTQQTVALNVTNQQMITGNGAVRN